MIEWIKKPYCTIDLEEDYEAFSQKAAIIVINSLSATLKEKGHVVLVPSAGKTPSGLYHILANKYHDALEWSRITVFQMDEYLGMPSTNSHSMAHYLHKQLIEPLSIKNFITLNDHNGDITLTPLEYQKKLEDMGGIDLVIHGLGRNGHIGFNEPGSDWLSESRITLLDTSTLEANFSGQDAHLRQKFRNGVTLGLGCLTKARHAILLVSGNGKDEAIKKLLQDFPGTEIPASSLCRNEKVHILINKETVQIGFPSEDIHAG